MRNALYLAMRHPFDVRGSAFVPSALFAAGEQGAWYDPSDFGTMFQDSAGTTPVTAVEQPVGLMLDKSKGLTLGPELSAYASGFSSTTGITGIGATVALSGASLVTTATSTDGADRAEIPISGLTTGQRYLVTIVARRGAQGTNQSIRTSTALNIPNSLLASTSNQTFTFRVDAIAASGVIRVYAADATGAVGDSIIVDRISVREIAGNHAFQSTAASRPVLSARVNMLLNTETLSTQSVTTVATNYRLRFTGAGTVTLSGTATGTFSAGTHSITATAGTLTLTVSGTVTQADLRTANVGTNLPVYQRVNTATDYDTTGFPLYLAFDGVDDGMVTSSINFSATDKMTVFAGVRKLSDATAGMLVEMSANAVSNAGAFYFAAPEDLNNRYLSLARGNAAASSTQSASTGASVGIAPDTAVISIAHDISGDLSTIWRNTVSGTSGTGDKGTGNYGNYPLFIGRRGGTTLPFNGRLYGLIVRGAASTAQQITQAESWMNQRTRAY